MWRNRKKEIKTFEKLEHYKEKLKEANILKNNFLENSKKMKKLEKDLIEYEKYKKIWFLEILWISFIFSFLKDLFSKNKE